jgi:putative PIN family toxin of toxin-antitoxin system
MIFLQAAVSDAGPAAALLRLVDQEVVSLYVSEEILAEIRDVLARPKLRLKNPRFTDEHVESLLLRIMMKGSVLTNIPRHFNYDRDPKDEKYLNLAVEAQADFLISRDRDLLDLRRDDTLENAALRALNPGLLVVDPAEFLRTIEQRSRV